jgi:hypothetical protein
MIRNAARLLTLGVRRGQFAAARMPKRKSGLQGRAGIARKRFCRHPLTRRLAGQAQPRRRPDSWSPGCSCHVSRHGCQHRAAGDDRALFPGTGQRDVTWVESNASASTTSIRGGAESRSKQALLASSSSVRTPIVPQTPSAARGRPPTPEPPGGAIGAQAVAGGCRGEFTYSWPSHIARLTGVSTMDGQRRFANACRTLNADGPWATAAGFGTCVRRTIRSAALRRRAASASP